MANATISTMIDPQRSFEASMYGGDVDVDMFQGEIDVGLNTSFGAELNMFAPPTEGEHGEKPRIAAKLRGPGPGRYGLPSTVGDEAHDVTMQKKPAAYSFGHRLGESFVSKICSPGPIYFIDAKYTRHGLDGTPNYSLLGRPKDPNEFKTPGPGSYKPESAHPQGERHAPKYSMASRTRYRRCDSYPAANAYGLPTLLGSKVPNKVSSASYSMTGRQKTGGFDEDLSKTPGAARYPVVDPSKYRRNAPSYSMLSRRYMPGDKTANPGPGAYHPLLVDSPVLHVRQAL